MANSNYDIAKKNYEKGYWTDAMLDKLVKAGKLTKDEAAEIKKGE